MKPNDWLKLADKTTADVAADFEMEVSTAWRHFNGLRTPKPDQVRKYEEYTKGAITAQDWIDLWNDPDAVGRRAAEKRQTQKRQAAA